MAEQKYVRAVTSFIVARPAKSKTNFGPGTVVHEGDVVLSTDPIVKGREALFMPFSEYVERATANPGEARTVTIPESTTPTVDPKES